jgi:hypothetical protein
MLIKLLLFYHYFLKTKNVTYRGHKKVAMFYSAGRMKVHKNRISSSKRVCIYSIPTTPSSVSYTIYQYL